MNESMPFCLEDISLLNKISKLMPPNIVKKGKKTRLDTGISFPFNKG